MISETRMDRENKAVKGMQLFTPKDTTKFNLIFSGSPVPAGLAKVMQDKLPWEERCSEDSLAPFPHYRHYSPPRSTASERFVPPPVEQVCDRRRNKWLLDRTAACQSWICPPVASHVFMVYVLLCWGVFFLFSHCTPQWSIVWGLNFFFPPLFPRVNAVFFLHSLSSCSVYPVVICMLCMYGQVDG